MKPGAWPLVGISARAEDGRVTSFSEEEDSGVIGLELEPARAPSRLPRTADVSRGARIEPAVRVEHLVGEHLDFVWRSLRRFGVREADVDDATQRVFLIAHEKLAYIEPGRERSFLVGIATRVASHVRRGYKRRDAAEQRLSSSPHPAFPDPEELTQRLEIRELLDRVLDRMPEELRAVFVLFELEELSVDEIARLLELPRGTAATRLRRAREVFRQCAQHVAASGERRARP